MLSNLGAAKAFDIHRLILYLHLRPQIGCAYFHNQLVTLQGVGNAVQVKTDDERRDGSRQEVRGASPTWKAGGSRRRHPETDGDGRRPNRTRKLTRGAS